MPRVACVGCGAEFPCAPSFRGRAPKCSACRPDATAAAKSAPQNGAAGAPQPSHMTPCACHCAACRAAGHGDGACVVLCAGLHTLFDGKADVVDLVLRHYYGACGWGTARLDAAISCMQYGPAGDVITAGDFGGRIHFLCAQTGEKILCPLLRVVLIDTVNVGRPLVAMLRASISRHVAPNSPPASKRGPTLFQVRRCVQFFRQTTG